MSRMKRILVVDDDARNLRMLCDIVQSLGYAPVPARNGVEALSKVGPDISLVLLDIMMPEMDGYQVVSEIRSNLNVGDVPIIMATFLNSKEDRLKAVEVGANDFISKPIDRLELKVRTASLLEMKDAQDALKQHLSQLEETVKMRTEALADSERRYKELYTESKRSERLYRSFLNSSPDAIVVLDPDARVAYLNPAFTSTFGWHKDELGGNSMPYILNSEASAYQRVIQDAMTTGDPFANLETRGVTKKGMVLDLSINGGRFLDHRGRAAGYVLTIRDVSERKMMEMALQESAERFRAMFDSAQDLIFVKDSHFTYTEVNPAMIDFMAVPRELILGKTDEDLFDQEYAKRTRDLETRVLEGQIIESEQRVTYQSRTVTWDVVRIPMRDTSGDVIGICGISRDVTERTSGNLEAETDPGEYPSAAMQATLAAAKLAARGDSTILLTGESGSGKDHLAKRIHELSSRSSGPYQAVNCAAIPQELAESELFGYEAGGFTGATRRKRGLLELAEGGTLLLNEIGELPPQLQAKLLSFLDTKTITRVGGEKHFKVNARLIAATNRDLETAVVEGGFRQDLYYRLNVFSIKIPPLRERIQDIPILSSQIVAHLGAQMLVSGLPSIHPDLIALFSEYTWPGNVRELRNVIERAMILSQGGPLLPDHCNVVPGKKERLPVHPHLLGATSLDEMLSDFERTLVQQALEESAGMIAPAARLLGITRYALARHMKKLGLSER
jgi:PAS domain S-box-containing protein